MGKHWWVRLHEKGGKRHEMPAHHNLKPISKPPASVMPARLPLSLRGRSTPLTGLWVTTFCSQRYSNSEASEASRCRVVLPPRPRRTGSSRQAMMCARVTRLDFSGRLMPAKPMKSRTAFFVGAARVGVGDVGEPFDFGRPLVEPTE